MLFFFIDIYLFSVMMVISVWMFCNFLLKGYVMADMLDRLRNENRRIGTLETNNVISIKGKQGLFFVETVFGLSGLNDSAMVVEVEGEYYSTLPSAKSFKVSIFDIEKIVDRN